MQSSYDKKTKLHFSEKKTLDSAEKKLSKKMEYYDKLFNQFENKFPKGQPSSTLKKPILDFAKDKRVTSKEELTPRIDSGHSIGDITARLKQFEIKYADQKEIHNERFANIEEELKEINKRLANLEDKQYNVTSKFSFDSKIEERLKKLEEKSEFVNSKLIDEKQLQIKIENFERMRKNSKDKNNANFQEDILNEINNLYSLLRKSLNNQRDIYLESQSLKKQINNKVLETELSLSKTNKYEQKSPSTYEQKSPMKYEQKSPKKYQPKTYDLKSSFKYEQRNSAKKYEQKSPNIYEEKSPRNVENKSPKKPLEVFEESKRKIYQEMKKDRSFSTGQKFKSYEDEGADLTRTKLNNEIEDLKYLNYTKQKQRDSFENNKSIEQMKLEEYQKRNEDLKEKYLVHERMHSYQNEYKKEKDLKFEDIEKRRKIDDEINKRLNAENEKRDKFLGNLENKRKILEKKEDFSNNRDQFKFSPFSTEKSRNQELASRLGLEKKLKDEKIEKLTDSLKYK